MENCQLGNFSCGVFPQYNSDDDGSAVASSEQKNKIKLPELTPGKKFANEPNHNLSL